VLREALTLHRGGRELDDGVGQRVGEWRAEAAGDAVLDDRARAALGHRDDRQSAGLGFEQDLPEGVGAAGEEEEVGARVGGGQRVTLEPTQEARVLAQALAQRVLLGAAAGQAQVQARVSLARGEEGVGQQIGALLAGQPAGVEHAQLARQRRVVAEGGRKAPDVDAAVPAPDALRVDPHRAQYLVGGRARR
jgi:hypothetical protein